LQIAVGFFRTVNLAREGGRPLNSADSCRRPRQRPDADWHRSTVAGLRHSQAITAPAQQAGPMLHHRPSLLTRTLDHRDVAICPTVALTPSTQANPLSGFRLPGQGQASRPSRSGCSLALTPSRGNMAGRSPLHNGASAAGIATTASTR
jgi:hypothetical protein